MENKNKGSLLLAFVKVMLATLFLAGYSAVSYWVWQLDGYFPIGWWLMFSSVIMFAVTKCIEASVE